MKLLRFFCASLAFFLCLPGEAPRAKVIFDMTEGSYSDDFSDNSGLSLEQNITVGHPLLPGVKVSLLEWCWKQPYSDKPEGLYSPFSHPGASHNLTEIYNPTGEPTAETVRLWEKKFLAGSQLELAPSVSTTNFGPKSRSGDFAFRPSVEQINGQFMARGPYQTDLLSRQDYTATFRAFYCDDAGCDETKNPSDATGVNIATLDVFHGIRLATFDMKLRGYSTKSAACGIGGGFSCESAISFFTLEFKVPDPLPAWKGFEYRVQISMSGTGGILCSPFCTATLWLDSVRIMAKGRPIQARDYVCTEDCAPGERPCGPVCVPIELPCGGDTATYYGGAGTYLSPVFDSLSEETVWTKVLWEVDQEISLQKPKAPVGIKWRVGNSPDPSVWMANPLWFTWTYPMLALNTPCPEQPIIMPDQGEYALYAEGDESKALTGRYFQYAVDFTGQYANERYPPEQDSPDTRQLHEAVGPALNSMEVCYNPAAGQIISNAVCASQLRNWRVATYEADVSTGGNIRVDVLDQNNVPLFANIPPRFSLTGLDPKEYPCLKLRATIDNEGDPDKRPRLLSWRLDWDVIATPLLLDRNSISLKGAGSVTVTMVLPVMLEGALTVHDVTGQLIKEIARGALMPGLNNWTWDGTNQKGEKVVPGVYFVTLKAGDIRQVRTIAVMP